jgi:hypothetical protein
MACAAPKAKPVVRPAARGAKGQPMPDPREFASLDCEIDPDTGDAVIRVPKELVQPVGNLMAEFPLLLEDRERLRQLLASLTRVRGPLMNRLKFKQGEQVNFAMLGDYLAECVSRDNRGHTIFTPPELARMPKFDLAGLPQFQR